MADELKSKGPSLDAGEVKKFTMGFNGAMGVGGSVDAAQSQLDAMKRRALKSQDSD